MAKVTLSTLAEMKKNGEKFTSLTAYDATLAHLVSSQGVEVILVGAYRSFCLFQARRSR